MRLRIEAACGCHMGRIRKNNEDNFFFDRKCLEMINQGLDKPMRLEASIGKARYMAVFDGMGGENFGENAAYAAAQGLQQTKRPLKEYFISSTDYLNKMVTKLNGVVLEEQQKMRTTHMGTTMVMLYFFKSCVYVCNLGDSRAYQLQEGKLLQISKDHVAIRPNGEIKKAPLIQYLGMDTQEMEPEPCIVRYGLKRGDKYLLCSDGLTDMLTDSEIADILQQNDDASECAETLIAAALEHGGRDNVTVIVCNIK